MAAMPPGRRIAEGGHRPTELLVGLGGTVALMAKAAMEDRRSSGTGSQALQSYVSFAN